MPNENHEVARTKSPPSIEATNLEMLSQAMMKHAAYTFRLAGSPAAVTRWLCLICDEVGDCSEELTKHDQSSAHAERLREFRAGAAKEEEP